MGLITLTDGAAVPPGFERRLRQLDPTLMVAVWRPAPPVLAAHPELEGKWRWCIYQCVTHQSTTAEHTDACRRAGCYVWMVQSDAGEFMPLGDRVLEHLKEMDMARKGYTLDARGLDAFRRDAAYRAQLAAARNERECAEIVRLNSRDHRRQLLQAHRLIQQHDLRINQ